MRKVLTVITLLVISSALNAETASWYTAMEPGYFTASGTIFDDSKDGAASNDIPLGSVVELSNPATGLSIVTTVTDTLPELPEGRTVALTKAAAEKLGMMDTGLADIKVSVIREGTITRESGGNTGWYSFDLGIFPDASEAEKIYSRLLENGLRPYASAEENGIHLFVRHVMAFQVEDTYDRIALSGIEHAELLSEANPYS